MKNNKGIALIGIIIVVIAAGIISGGVYYYLSKQIPVPEIIQKLNEETPQLQNIAPSSSEEVLKEETKPEETPTTSQEKVIPPESEITCQNECSQDGLKRCFGNGYQTCGNYDTDTCLEWSSTTSCSANTICQNGNCIQQKCSDGTLYNQCSNNKPKYCYNGNLIDNCQMCGCSDNMVCQEENTCVEINQNECINLVKNGKTSEKIDVVFIPDGYIKTEEGLFISHIQNTINTFFSIEPFKSNSTKFNFYYTATMLSANCENVYSEFYGAEKRPHNCSSDKILSLASICPHDQIIVLTKFKGDHGISFGSYLISAGEAPIMTLHEFGHAFGDLGDEYYLESPISNTAAPNCDVFGCPKWCSGEPLDVGNINNCNLITTQEECQTSITHNGIPCMWSFVPGPYCQISAGTIDPPNVGTNCKAGFGCYNNCRGSNGYRSALDGGLMGAYNPLGQYTGEEHFSPAAKQYLLIKLDQYK